MNAVNTFFTKLGADIAACTLQHVVLTCLALAIAIAIAVPAGILLARTKMQRLPGLVMGGAGVIQTIPTLALIALVVLVFARVALPTVGTPPALVALVMYALLPILRNTFTALRQVDSAIIEVATGMGMTRNQILLKVELPLALPVIMAGVRIAAVWTIGTAALCGLIGAGGLGDLILRGLRSYQMDYLLAGAVPAALLALVFDFGLGTLERLMTPRGLRVQE
jgi:osmoprotectant transport system permease protein